MKILQFKPSIFIFLLFLPIFILAQEKANRDSLNELLLLYTFDNNYFKVEDLLEMGANVNTVAADGITPIFYAIEKANLKLVNLLISKNANLNFQAQDKTGETPLILATRLGHTDIVRTLAANKANVGSQNNDGSSALHFAAFFNDTVILRLLLSSPEINIDAQNKNGSTPLAFAASNGSYNALKLLVNAGADVNVADNSKNSPLILACANGHYNNAVILLENWAGINAVNKNNYSALYYSIVNNYPDIADLLILNGANLNESYSISLNPLSLSKLYKMNNLSDSLKKYGAKRNYLPSFRNLGGIGLTTRFNNRDFITGLKYLAKDEKFNFEYALYYNIRPFAVPVLQKTEDSVFYQFWERRNIIGLSLGKLFQKKTRPNNYIGPFIEVLYEYHWGKYRGTDMSINSGLQISPCIGIEGKKNHALYRFSFIYKETNIRGLPDWYLDFSIMFAYHKKRRGINMAILP